MAKIHFFDVTLAEKYGPVEAVLLTNLCFWIEKNAANQTNFHEGRYWTYNSAAAFEKLFTYLNKDQIRRVLNNLKESGVIYTGNFNKIGYDRTLWYSVCDEVMKIYNDNKNYEPPDVKNHENGRPNGLMDVVNSPNPFAHSGGNDHSGIWGEIEGKTAEITKNDANNVETLENGRPNGLMDVANSPNPFAHSGGNDHSGVCISRNRQIDSAFSPDRFGENASPIPDINIYKPSSSDSQEAEKEFLLKSLKKMFLSIDGRFVFSENFYETASAVMRKYGFGEDYCRWLYRYCLNVEPDNIRGYYYKLFDKQEMIELYLSSGLRKIDKKPDSRCPVCETVFDSNLSQCPVCFFHITDINDEYQIEYQKRYFALSDEDKNNYIFEINTVFKYFIGKPEYESKMREVEERYGLLSLASCGDSG